jgi:putative flippase GtrA
MLIGDMNHAPAPDSLNRTAFQATVHCLTGCGIGEVLGLVLSTALGWHDLPSILLAIVLAFIFGYGLTIRPLLSGGLSFRSAARTALAADTVSIVVMEVMDNAIVIAVPGAMAAGLTDGLFWGSLVLSLAVAFVVAFPVNRWLIARGLGHAVVHAQHHAEARPPHD